MERLPNWSRKILGILAILFIFHDVFAMRPLHLQNFDDAKTELRTAIGQRPDNGPLSIITVTRSPVHGGATDLISHDELAQLLRLLYSLCNGTGAPSYSEITAVHYIPFLSYIPGVDKFRNWFWRNLRVSLNLSPRSQLTAGHQHIRDVDGFCDDFRYFHDQYLRKACNIVVFNEMFFSQVDPLTLEQKDFITDKLIELSSWSRNSFFYPNFLYVERREVSGNMIHNVFSLMEANSLNNRMNIRNAP